jgi:hypothetical protein
MFDEEMTIDEKYKYLRKQQKRYKNASREEKGELLDEMEEVTGLHRKSLIRLMNGDLTRKPRSKEREKNYKGDVTLALQVIAESMDWICAERLQPNLVWMADHLVAHGELKITDKVRAQLGEISTSTVRRRLQALPRDRPRLPRKGPKQANRLAREVPTRRIPWDEQQPGHFEVDTVHHSGPAASGHYIHTLQMIDVATGWSERAATLGRSYLVMEDAFRRILARLPFPVVEIHPDNGSEFLNSHLVRFWKDKVRDVHLSRSRPWYKNDNRFVEQKNDTLVRAYLGHDRLDTVEQSILLNQLYDKMWLYYNFFQPVMRLEQKTVVPIEGQPGSKVRRRFDEACTPFDRLCAASILSPDKLAELQSLRDDTNPRQLRHDIYALLDQLFALPCAVPNEISQSVYLTLFQPPDSMKGEGGPVTLSNERTIPVR